MTLLTRIDGETVLTGLGLNIIGILLYLSVGVASLINYTNLMVSINESDGKMVKATQKRTYFLNGGPYDGQTILLATPTTLVFTTRNMTGRYRPGEIIFPVDNSKELLGVSKELVTTPIEGYTDVILIWEKH